MMLSCIPLCTKQMCTFISNGSIIFFCFVLVSFSVTSIQRKSSSLMSVFIFMLLVCPEDVQCSK